MKVKTKKKVKTTVTVSLSYDEAQYLHALLMLPTAVVEAAGWSKAEDEWDDAAAFCARLYNHLDNELF